MAVAEPLRSRAAEVACWWWIRVSALRRWHGDVAAAEAAADVGIERAALTVVPPV